jgi:hypothetical protein
MELVLSSFLYSNKKYDRGGTISAHPHISKVSDMLVFVFELW